MSQKRTAALGTHSELGLSDFYTSWSLDWFDGDQIALSLLFESNAQTLRISLSSDDVVNCSQKTHQNEPVPTGVPHVDSTRKVADVAQLVLHEVHLYSPVAPGDGQAVGALHPSQRRAPTTDRRGNAKLRLQNRFVVADDCLWLMLLPRSTPWLVSGTHLCCRHP